MASTVTKANTTRTNPATIEQDWIDTRYEEAEQMVCPACGHTPMFFRPKANQFACACGYGQMLPEVEPEPKRARTPRENSKRVKHLCQGCGLHNTYPQWCHRCRYAYNYATYGVIGHVGAGTPGYHYTTLAEGDLPAYLEERAAGDAAKLAEFQAIQRAPWKRVVRMVAEQKVAI